MTPTNNVLCVVPARLGSERLLEKPLRVLAGRPLIEWVYRRVSGFGVVDAVVVATDSERVADACRAAGAEVELTSPAHPSGTDRVAEVAERARWQGYGILVNVQGDEPLIEASHVAAAIDRVRGGFDIGTVATPVGRLADWRDPSVVKVARRSDGAAMYFTRSPIPWRRDGQPSAAELTGAPYLRHVGIYAYTRAALRRWVALPVGELEAIEKLEQLRPLAAGLSIGVSVVDAAEGGVDTEADVARVERRLQAIEESEPRATVER